jgi:CheY-like chemotaxis protein
MQIENILVVEDEPLSAEIIGMVLSDMGLGHLHAENGEEALHLYQSYADVRLILMDLNLPGASGQSITETIRANAFYREKPVPIIATTGNALPEDKASYLARTGFADYLTKPITHEKLRTALAPYFPSLLASSA